MARMHILVGLVLLVSSVGSTQTTQGQWAQQLVNRQARAWERQDFRLAAADWLPGAVLTSPEGNTPASEMSAAMAGYFKDFGDLKVTVKNLVISPDGKKMAIEWDWAVTRKRDGKRGVSHDAIMVDLKDGKIASWREYYDPAASGESNP